MRMFTGVELPNGCGRIYDFISLCLRLQKKLSVLSAAETIPADPLSLVSCKVGSAWIAAVFPAHPSDAQSA